MAAPFLLLGMFFAGIIYKYVSRSWLMKYMGQNNVTSVIVSSVVGIALPLCSCGVIPTGVGMYRAGVRKCAILSFLIATPALNPAAILITYSILGVEFTLARIVMTVAVALVTGILALCLLSDEREIMVSPIGETTISTKAMSIPKKSRTEKIGDFIDAMKYGYYDLTKDIGLWILVGLFGAALIGVLIPTALIQSWLGSSGLLPLLVMGSIGTPMYVCSSGSVPMVGALLGKGMVASAGLVFLITGPATNLATMLLVWKELGKMSFFLYLCSIFVGTILFAMLFGMVMVSVS
jgi:hypothetical protein